MSQYISLFRVRSSPNLVLALVASFVWLIPEALADSSLGTDAPGTPSSSNGASSADNTAGASGDNGGLSKSAQIVIGVVVGVVSMGAIAGAVYFFFWKKRKWDEKAERYEVISAYRKSMGERRQHEMSLRTQRRRRERRPDIEQGELEISVPQLPKYDPSIFHKQQYSIDSTRGGLSIDLGRNSYMGHQRNSSQFSGIMHPPPSAAAPGRATASMDLDRGASPTYEGTSHSNPSSPTPMIQPATGSRGTFKTPKRPKPVLSRLITNL
ncbi:hypothetical protein BGW36DRAFT_123954 [Talaromyces proteolyticus]|uniref:Uncharacterized protein n=1 Tax=Talaromyces proteolyticus TaxID=1131652 RepID=A0AAD4KUE6_9EURO|nr:uncharacterized protein BGW36DRAFT_123954 [Talaromyces proteolyticus]KAH8700171.1 hypothetical protein BGW36DRAFT_123954 [Talaromyces proteolyticus]